MFQNYIISAFRNILKNPLFSLINIGGLAIGLAVCTLVYLYVDRELNFDSWVEEPDNLYRIEMSFQFEGWGSGHMTSVMVPLMDVTKENIPEITKATLFEQNFDTIKKGNTVFYENVAEIDPEFLKMFPLTYIYGDERSALPNINTIILTEKLALKYFGQSNPVGQMVTYAGNREMIVGAVVKDLPTETHMNVDAFIQYRYGIHPYQSEWSSNSPWMYVQVNNPADLPTIHEKLYQIVAEHKPFMGDDEETPNEKLTMFLQPFKDVHLVSRGRTPQNPYGNLAYIFGYIAIAGLILGISCINYVNLSTARATKRTREVCMRKIMGASRKQLLGQFLGEAIFMAVIALVLAIGLVFAILPWFKAVVGGELSMNLFSDLKLWTLFLGMIIFTGALAGAYPALYVSQFKPSKFLHSNKSDATGSARLRNGLVVVQFTIATALIAIVAVIYTQMAYVSNMNLGFKSEGLVVLRGVNSPLTKGSQEALKAELERIPGISYVAGTYNVPGDGRTSSRTATMEGMNPDEAPSPQIMPSDYEFLEAMSVPLIAGRYLDKNLSTDDATPTMEKAPEGGEIPVVSASVVINRMAVSKFGISSPEEAIGKTFNIGLNAYGARGNLTVVGVVEDFIFGGAKHKVREMVFYRQAQVHQQLLLKVNPGQMEAVLTKVDETWRTMYPDVPVRRDFIDQRVERYVERENAQSRLFLGFSVLAILLSCMGLLGLVVFTAEQRTKEIGVRKVMGASSFNIIKMLSWQFSKPMILANILALPTAWYFASSWLESFSQRIDLGPSYFVLASFMALFIGLSTVVWHSWRAARTHPIRALRYE